jgi:protein-tyrosine phosphatase
MKLLFVCLGNICRSPLAEGIMKHKIAEQGLDWEVDSAGTGGWHAGDLPDSRSIQVAQKHGVDLTYQRARKLRSIDYETFDRIYVMDSMNYQDVKRLANEDEYHKIELIMNEVEPHRNINVPDPYYGEGDGFEHVFQMLDRACDAIIKKYCKKV